MKSAPRRGEEIYFFQLQGVQVVFWTAMVLESGSKRIRLSCNWFGQRKGTVTTLTLKVGTQSWDDFFALVASTPEGARSNFRSFLKALAEKHRREAKWLEDEVMQQL